MEAEKTLLTGKRIVLGVTGSIAAYKAVELVRLLKDDGAEVRIAMTKNAQHFVTAMTFQAISGQRVVCELFDLQSEFIMTHIDLAKWADVLVFAPATANSIAKLAHGIADDYLTTIALACDAPLIVCPAMNVHMYLNESTQENIRILKKRGVTIIGPAEGQLACGDEGPGRFEEVSYIREAIIKAVIPQALEGKKVLVTAGPTWEAFDPVRFFTNPSSGKMGYAMARHACLKGAEVELVTGPTLLDSPRGVHCSEVKSAQEMYKAVLDIFPQVDLVVMAAAVSDYCPVEFSAQKMKKTSDRVELEMVQTPDILKELGKRKENQILVGFAAETEDLIANARQKLEKKNLDLIVANDVSLANAGFRSDTNIVKILYSSGEIEELPCMDKEILAVHIWERIERLFSSC